MSEQTGAIVAEQLVKLQNALLEGRIDKDTYEKLKAELTAVTHSQPPPQSPSNRGGSLWSRMRTAMNPEQMRASLADAGTNIGKNFKTLRETMGNARKAAGFSVAPSGDSPSPSAASPVVSAATSPTLPPPLSMAGDVRSSSESSTPTTPAMSPTELLLRSLAQVMMRQESCSLRHFRNKTICIDGLLQDIEDFIKYRLKLTTSEHFHADDWWVFALADQGGILLKGTQDDLLLKAYLPPDTKALKKEVAEVGAKLGGGALVAGAASIGAVAVVSGVAGSVALAALAPIVAPLAIGTALGLAGRKQQKIKEAHEIQENLADRLAELAQGQAGKS